MNEDVYGLLTTHIVHIDLYNIHQYYITCEVGERGRSERAGRVGWRVESGEWRAESGEWRVESGEWRVESGEWRVESGEFRGERGHTILATHECLLRWKFNKFT